jgi:PAS domain S-box-containing protein
VAAKHQQQALAYAPDPQAKPIPGLPRRPLEAAPEDAREAREWGAMLELVHDSILVRGMDGVVTCWSRGAESLYGWTAAQALGQPVHQLLHTVFPCPLEQIEEALMSAGRWEGELQHSRKDGTPVLVASRWALHRDPHGAPAGVVETGDVLTDRRRAERELEEQWRAAFESNPTMYFIVDQAGTIVSVNPVGAEQLGYALGELVGLPVLDIFYQPDRAFVQQKADSCFSYPGRTFRWEARKVRKDGQILWVRETANAVKVRDRAVLLVACEDVTQQKRVEEALRDSEERFRTLVNFSFDVYWESDAQHRFVRQEFDGTVPNAPANGAELGKTRWEVPYLEPDEEAWRKHRETLDAHLPFRDFELARPMPDGSKRYVSVSGLPVFDSMGNFTGYRGVGRHITERKRADEMLRQREKELREIIETVPAMVFVTDAQGRNAVANRRWLEYTGLGPEGANSRLAIHPEDASRNAAARRNSIATGESFEQEVRLRRFDGAYRWFLGRAVPLRGEHGNILKWYGVHTDIHDRKLAEEERAAHLWFLESLDRINRAMQGANDLERMMSDVLDAVLEVFACDRAWLIYPCDPEAATWRAVMEHTRPQFPGALALGADMPADADMANVFRLAAAAGGAVLFGPGAGLPVAASSTEKFAVRSQMVMAVRPKVGRTYLFGLHQCSYARSWTEQERRLFEEVGRRLDDALTSLLIFRSLSASERKLEEAQRIGHMGYFELDLGKQRLTLSDEACRIHGLEQHQLAAWQGRALELVHPGDRARVSKAMMISGKGEGRFDFEFRLVHANGDVRIVHSRGETTRDTEGRRLRAFGTLQDVTELRHAQDELAASELRHRRIFHEASVSIWEEDFSQVEAALDELRNAGVRDFRAYVAAHPEFVRRAISLVGIRDVNDATLRMFGASSKDQLLGSLDCIFVPETEANFAEQLIALADGRTSFQSECVVRTLQGERLSVLIAIAFPPRDSKSASTLVSLMDITERTRAQQLTRHIFETSPDGMAVVGRDYRYQRVNPAFERSSKMPAEQIIGLQVREVHGGDMFERKFKPYLDRCFAGEQVSFADWFTGAAGRFYYSVIYAPLRLGSDHVEAVLAIRRDLTDHMLASQALRDAEAALARVNRVTTLGVLAASIAHEVNQPLGAMITSAGACTRWLAAEPPEMDKARSALQRIVNDGSRAGQVVDRIRALVNRQAPRRSRVDLNEAILEVIALTRDEVRRHAIALDTSLAADLPPIEGDRVQLQQVVLNLLVNAIEAMGASRLRPRQLAIASAACGADAVTVEVRDSGPGFDPDQAQRLFEAFYTTKEQGIGMGLSISRSIIEAHGGKLWVTPNVPRGAAFRFSLPVGHGAP